MQQYETALNVDSSLSTITKKPLAVSSLILMFYPFLYSSKSLLCFISASDLNLTALDGHVFSLALTDSASKWKLDPKLPVHGGVNL